MSNTLGLSKKYLRFLVDNINSRWVLLQGGRRSGKSWAVLRFLWLLASGEPKTVGVICASFPALQNCISDFQRATGLKVTGSVITGYNCTLSNGSQFLFRSFDTPEKAQGTSYSILYLEECLNIPEQIVKVLSMSVTGQIYCSYNPTKASYLDGYIKPDKSNFLKTTYKDNEHLTPEQIKEFEDIKAKSLLPTASLFDIYAATVYCDGDFGSMSGKVFKLVHVITDEEYDAVPAPELYAIDFAFTMNEQSDATALVGCKIHGEDIYYKEYIYSNKLAGNKELALRMAEIGLDVYSPIVADYGGLGASRIKALVTAGDYQWREPEISSGFSIQNAQKGKVIDGLQRMNQYKIHVTESSVNLRNEMDNYELNAEGKPKSGLADHAIDASRYATNSYYINFDYAEPPTADTGC